MEGSFRIIYALCIIFIRFPLYYLAPVQDNFYTLYNDTNLCNNSFKEILYKSEYTKECCSMKYYEELDKFTINLENIQQFLCLGIYDTVYKVCQYTEIKQWNKSYDQTFDSKIRDLMEIYEKGEFNMTSKDFCNDLAGYTPMYDKLKPALSQLAFKFESPELCFSICFDLGSKFKTPLCAILLWINRIDQEIARIPKIDLNTVKTDGVDYKNDLKDKQGNHKDHLNIQHEIDNPKSLENKMKEKTTHHVEKPATNISTNNVTKNNSSINSNNNQNEQLPQSKKYLTDKKSNPVVKPDSMAKTTLKSTSTSMINNISESHDKPTSLLKEVDKNPVDNDINSQEPAPHIETDDSKSKKKDKVDPEKNSITSKHVNQIVTETKSTKAFNNPKISITESNIAADGSNHQKNAPTEETEIDPFGGTDNPSESMSEPSEQRAHFENDEESHFLFYFGVISIGFIGGYTGYHNKKKLLAIVLKGRRSKNNRGRRRSSSPKYRKLDCTLEEAVTSQCNANVTHVIY